MHVVQDPNWNHRKISNCKANIIRLLGANTERKIEKSQRRILLISESQQVNSAKQGGILL
jgi:hypothetical protein